MKTLLLTLISLSFSIQAFASTQTRIPLEGTVTKSGCAAVIRLSAVDADMMGEQTLSIKLVGSGELNGQIFNITEYHYTAPDSPMYTENKLYISTAPSNNTKNVTCTEYNIGDDISSERSGGYLYSTYGDFTIKYGEKKMTLDYQGAGMACPAPHRSGGAFKARYEWDGSNLYQTAVLVPKVNCDERD
jgi:hypothetical protein